jgi:hypothetical protein
MPTRPTLAGVQNHENVAISSGSWSFSQPTETQVGDLLVHVGYCFAGSDDGVSRSHDGITLPSGWSSLFQTTFDGVSGARVRFYVLYREAGSAGLVSHSGNQGFTNSETSKDRAGVTFAIRGHRLIGVDGGPFADYNHAVDGANDGSTIASRSVAAGAVTPGVLDTLLLGAFFAESTINNSAASAGQTPPSGMTIAETFGATGSSQITYASYYELLTSAAATAAKTAGISGHTGGRVYHGDAGAILAIRAPNTTPGAPGAFTTPSAGQAIAKGATILINWGNATDADGDAITYELEYRYNGGAWTPWQPSLAASQHSWNTSAETPGTYELRVRASDGYTTSGWTQSSAFTIVAGGPRMIVG